MAKKEPQAGYNTKDMEIHTSVKGVQNTHMDVTFVKDQEQLLYQYDNLIRSLGKRYSKWCKTKEDRENLYSYIKDAFISLVTEYDPLSGVDFPGYIKGKLALRVYNSYLTSERDYMYRNAPLRAKDYSVSDLLGSRDSDVLVSSAGTPPTEKEPKKGQRNTGVIKQIKSSNLNNLDLVESITDIVQHSGLTSLQLEILDDFMEGETRHTLLQKVGQEHPELTKAEISRSLEGLKRVLRDYYDLPESY